MEHLLRSWPVRVFTTEDKDNGSSNIRIVSFGIAFLVCEHPIQKRPSPYKPVSCWGYTESELGCQYGLLPIWWIVATKTSLGPCWDLWAQLILRVCQRGWHWGCIQTNTSNPQGGRLPILEHQMFSDDHDFTARWCWTKSDISQALTITQITGYTSEPKHSWAEKQKPWKSLSSMQDIFLCVLQPSDVHRRAKILHGNLITLTVLFWSDWKRWSAWILKDHFF